MRAGGRAAVTRPVPAGAGEAEAATLRVGGLVPYSGVDLPGKLCAVVFVQGCPWRCGYCHNPHLQSRDGGGQTSWTEVVALLERRVGLLDAVVFSGGEPTLDPALATAMREVRGLGFQVGLHTAGMYPRRLAEVLPLVDWIGLDVKAPLDEPARHDRVTGVAGGAAAVHESVTCVVRSGVAHEFRTTAHPALLDDAALLRIGQSLARAQARAFAVQVARPVRDTPAALPAVGAGYPSEATLRQLAALIPSFALRRE